MPPPSTNSKQSVQHLSGVLLTTADRQIEKFTVGTDPTRSFEDSFYEAVLFHERVVLPDIFAFISTALHKAQISSKTFHLDAAIEAGLVVPAFRSATTSFEESLTTITAQRIQGMQAAPDFIATRLDEAFAKSPKRTFIQWPKDLSRDYGVLVLATLNRIAEEVKAWSLTTEFINRHAILERIKADIDAENGELRRGNFYNILLATLNSLSPTAIARVNDCYADLLLHPACKDEPTVREPIRNLLVVANTAYHLNMASAFEAGSYTPGRLIAPEALPALKFVVSTAKALTIQETQAESRPIDTLSVDVVIPSVELLRTARWEDLVAVREDLGCGYFAALKNWYKHPDEFTKCLKNYAAALTSRIKVKVPPIKVILNRFSESEREGIVGVTKHALAEMAEMRDGKLLLSLAGIGCNISMSWMHERSIKLSFAHSPHDAIVV